MFATKKSKKNSLQIWGLKASQGWNVGSDWFFDRFDGDTFTTSSKRKPIKKSDICSGAGFQNEEHGGNTWELTNSHFIFSNLNCQNSSGVKPNSQLPSMD